MIRCIAVHIDPDRRLDDLAVFFIKPNATTEQVRSEARRAMEREHRHRDVTAWQFAPLY